MDASTDFDGNDGRASDRPTLVVDVDGFEGPLDLLLDLARRQKVDLRSVSVMALAEQYLSFIQSARALRLDLAADYLVMAAWLAFLKSRLLLPGLPESEPKQDAADLASALALRLARLEAVRAAAQRLSAMPQLGRDVFARGEPETRQAEDAPTRLTATLFDLLEAYASRRQRQGTASMTLAPRRVWTMADARSLLDRLVGGTGEWVDLQDYLGSLGVEPSMRRSAVASMFSAALEMAREGRAMLSQSRPFAALAVRVATLAPEPAP